MLFHVQFKVTVRHRHIQAGAGKRIGNGFVEFLGIADFNDGPDRRREIRAGHDVERPSTRRMPRNDRYPETASRVIMTAYSFAIPPDPKRSRIR